MPFKNDAKRTLRQRIRRFVLFILEKRDIRRRKEVWIKIGRGSYSTSPIRSRRGIVLACGAVSADWQRSLHRIEHGHLNTEKYLEMMDSIVSSGRTIFSTNNPAHGSVVAAQYISSRQASSILWPPRSLNIMPMTSILKHFVDELNYATSMVPNPDQLWGGMEIVWLDFIANNSFVYPTTVGYVWPDPGKIVDEFE